MPDALLADLSQQDAIRNLFRAPARAGIQYAEAVLHERSPRAYLCHPRPYVGVLARNLAKYRLLEEFLRTRGLSQAIFYDYWLENTTLALSWLRGEGVVTGRWRALTGSTFTKTSGALAPFHSRGSTWGRSIESFP